MGLVLPADPVEVEDPGHLRLARVGERRARPIRRRLRREIVEPRRSADTAAGVIGSAPSATIAATDWSSWASRARADRAAVRRRFRRSGGGVGRRAAVTGQVRTPAGRCGRRGRRARRGRGARRTASTSVVVDRQRPRGTARRRRDRTRRSRKALTRSASDRSAGSSSAPITIPSESLRQPGHAISTNTRSSRRARMRIRSVGDELATGGAADPARERIRGRRADPSAASLPGRPRRRARRRRPAGAVRIRCESDTPRGYHRTASRPSTRRPPVPAPATRRTPAPPPPANFRHSYSKDKSSLVRRLSRMEGQVRGIARMIEREEYCVDILQQTAALRAAVDAVSILVLEDHVQGCVRTAAEAGRGGRVRGRGDRRRAANAGPAGPREHSFELT